jgi:hypothetical protein
LKYSNVLIFCAISTQRERFSDKLIRIGIRIGFSASGTLTARSLILADGADALLHNPRVNPSVPGDDGFIPHDEGASDEGIAFPGTPGAQGGKAPSGSGGGNALGFPPTG